MRFDAEHWAAASRVVQVDRATTPAELTREELTEIADQLHQADWSFRSISSALGVPTTTIHRWVNPTTNGNPEPRGGAAAVALIAAACGIVLAILRKTRPP